MAILTVIGGTPREIQECYERFRNENKKKKKNKPNKEE